jgi:hypothetical protein
VRDFSCHSKVSARQRHAGKGNATSWLLFFLAHGWLMTGRFHFFSVCSALITRGPQAAALWVPFAHLFCRASSCARCMQLSSAAEAGRHRWKGGRWTMNNLCKFRHVLGLGKLWDRVMAALCSSDVFAALLLLVLITSFLSLSQSC